MSAKYNQIVSLLDQMKADYEVLEHEPAFTSKDAAKVTGHSADIGAKSIVFKVGDSFMLIVVRGSGLVDFNKLRKLTGVRKARLATPEEVLSVMDVTIGACYPFGSIAGTTMFVDETLAENEHISFSPGLHDKHIIMPWSEYVRVEGPTLADVRRQ